MLRNAYHSVHSLHCAGIPLLRHRFKGFPRKCLVIEKADLVRILMKTRHKKRIRVEHNYTSDNVGGIEQVDTITDKPEFNYRAINADFKQGRRLVE